MLVYPLNDLWDQNGNAARVKFHGLGLRGSVRSDRVSDITIKIKRLFESPEFRKTAGKWKKVYRENNNSIKAVEIVEALLNETVSSPAV
jgi:UDP:flavonoid glycosyltransferase YjiC (YdhE family)